MRKFWLCPLLFFLVMSGGSPHAWGDVKPKSKAKASAKANAKTKVNLNKKAGLSPKKTVNENTFMMAPLNNALAAPPPLPPKIIYKKEEQHQFAGTRLKGQVKKPDLSYIYERKGLREEKIVDIPDNFNEEIIHGTGRF